MFERGDVMSGGDLSAGCFEVSGPRTFGWREIDAALRAVAKRRATLDAEEARWLIAAHTAELHRHFGYATFHEYMERVLGYGPGVATDRLRVAAALVELPAMARELGAGRLTYSAVRELSRVVVPETETVWLAAARGRTVRDVEAMVTGHKPGDLPDAPRTPADTLALRALRFEVKPQTMALMRQCVRVLEDERGERLDDDEVLTAMCRAVLEGGGEAGTRARHQVAITVCSECKRGWQDAAGASFEVPPPVVERAECDAQVIDLVSSARKKTPVSEARRLEVWRRDGGRCCVPGCRATRFLDIHHLKHRRDGGDNSLGNLCLLCWGHHDAHHDGRLLIEGSISTGLVFKHADGRPYGETPEVSSASVFADAISALCTAGFTPSAARAAVDAARPHVGPNASLQAILKVALRSLHPGAG
jgi:hypothetical protein